jgi:hypothetical protein
MHRPLTIAALLCAWLLASVDAKADATGNCGSVASAPAQPGTSRENEPRGCDEGSAYEPQTAQPPVPEDQSPDAATSPQPSVPIESPEEIPEPPPQ